MNQQHIDYLTPKLKRLAELTCEFVPLANELKRYSYQSGISEKEVEILVRIVAPDIAKLMDEDKEFSV